MTRFFARLGLSLLVTAGIFSSVPASAKVTLSFYSVQTSLMSLRSVHAFFDLKGTLDSDGTVINENYGFSAKNSSFGLFFHPVKQAMLSENQSYIDKANYHFSVTISDATYHQIVSEVDTWAHNPDYKWDIDKRNCVTFVGVVAQMAGLKVDFPKEMMRKPKTYLTHIKQMNPKVLAMGN